MKKTTIASLSDSELVKNFRAGDKRAFDSIVIRHRPSLLSMMTFRTGNKETAEDIIQDTFVKAFNFFRTYQECKSSLKTWLWAIAKRIHIDQYRLKSISTTSMIDEHDERWNSLQYAHPSPEARFLGPYKEYDLHLLISKLPPRLSEVMALRTFKDLKHHEIAEIKNVAEGTVKGYIHRSVIRLRSMMEEVYGVEIKPMAA